MNATRTSACLAAVAGLGLLVPVEAFAGKDPADYPLRVEIIRSAWERVPGARSRCGSSTGASLACPLFTGWGVGSVVEGQTIRGFDFKYDCSFALRRTLGASHPAKWKKPLRRLAVLVEKIGEEGKYDACTLTTTMQAGVGIVRPQSSRVLGQDDDSRSGSPGPGAGVPVVVSSSPDGADIEVDGRFVGSTPSSIPLGLGEHVVVVRKLGFKPWERKLHLAGGRVTLSADLERDAAK